MKFTPQVRRRIYEAMSIGCTYELAARHAGIGESTMYYWLAKGREGEPGYQEFLEEVKRCEARCAAGALGVLLQAAREGKWQAAAWLLERRHGYTAKDRAPVEITIESNESSVIDMIKGLQQDEDFKKLMSGPVIDLNE